MKMNAEQYIENCKSQANSLFRDDEPISRIKYETELLRALVRTLVMMINQENEHET